MITSKTNAALIGIILGICLLLGSFGYFYLSQGTITVRADSNAYTGTENAFVRGKNFFAHGKVKLINYKKATEDDGAYTEVAPTEIGKYKVKIVVEKYLDKELKTTIVDYEIKRKEIKLNIYRKYASSNIIKYNLTKADGLIEGDNLTLKIEIDASDSKLSTIKSITTEGNSSHYLVTKENITAKIGTIFHSPQVYYDDGSVPKPYHDKEFSDTLPEPYVKLLSVFSNENEMKAFEEMKNSDKTQVQILWCRSSDGSTQNHTIMGDDVSDYENGFRDYILYDPLRDTALNSYSVQITYYYDGYEALTAIAYFTVNYKA